MENPPSFFGGYSLCPRRESSCAAVFPFLFLLFLCGGAPRLLWCHPADASSPVEPITDAIFVLRGGPRPRSTYSSMPVHSSIHPSRASSAAFRENPVDRMLNENDVLAGTTLKNSLWRTEGALEKILQEANRQSVLTGPTAAAHSGSPISSLLQRKETNAVAGPLFVSQHAFIQVGGTPVFSGQLGTSVDVMPDSEEDIAVMPNCLFYSSYPGSCVPGSAHSPCRYCRAKQFSGLYGAAQCPSFTSFPPELQSLYRWRITPAKRSRVKGWSDELVCVVEKTAMADHLQRQQAGAFRVVPTAATRVPPNPFISPYQSAAAVSDRYILPGALRVPAAATMSGLLVSLFRA